VKSRKPRSSSKKSPRRATASSHLDVATAPRAAPGGTEAAPPAGGGPRTIRRYGNRRLYDSQLSRCVTMEEIAGFVRAGDEVRVVDADSGEDITRRILVQIILEDSNRTQLEMLPVTMLRSLLSHRSDPLSSWLEQYLAAGAEWIDSAARQAAAVATPPIAAATAGAAGWNWPFLGFTGFPGFPSAAGFAAPAAPPASSAATSAAPPNRDTEADLRRRLDELERALAGLAQKRR
jgi:polyhydroxyalkanoate synthesis repressor PhaR